MELVFVQGLYDEEAKTLQTIRELSKAVQLDMFGGETQTGKRKPGEIRQTVKPPRAATGNLFDAAEAGGGEALQKQHDDWHQRTGMGAEHHNANQLLRDLAATRKPGVVAPEAEGNVLDHLAHLRTHHPETVLNRTWDTTPQSGKANAVAPTGQRRNAGGQSALLHGVEGPGGQQAMGLEHEVAKEESPAVEQPEAKQPWQMTRNQYLKQAMGVKTDQELRESSEKHWSIAHKAANRHSDEVLNAARRGESVPWEVLAGHPQALETALSAGPMAGKPTYSGGDIPYKSGMIGKNGKEGWAGFPEGSPYHEGMKAGKFRRTGVQDRDTAEVEVEGVDPDNPQPWKLPHDVVNYWEKQHGMHPAPGAAAPDPAAKPAPEDLQMQTPPVSRKDAKERSSGRQGLFLSLAPVKASRFLSVLAKSVDDQDCGHAMNLSHEEHEQHLQQHVKELKRLRDLSGGGYNADDRAALSKLAVHAAAHRDALAGGKAQRPAVGAGVKDIGRLVLAKAG